MHIKRLLVSLMVMTVIFAGLQLAPDSASANNYLTVNKTVSPSSILEGEEVEVSLDITGTPPVDVVLPNDVVLIIDRSGSMGTQKMEDAKNSAKGFIDLMDFSKHRVGIVDYSDTSRTFELTTDTAAAKNYISSLKSGGGTATGDAILKAKEMLQNHRDDAQPVIVLLTDGDATIPTSNPYQFALDSANEAKEAGIVFYTIALLETNANPETSGPNLLMKEMATTAHHHHFVLGSVGLSDIYAAIVQEIGLASAYDVVVNDVISDKFEIVPGSYDNNIPRPTVDGNKLSWSFLEMKKDTLTFTYKIRHKKDSGVGSLPVNASGSTITYKDYTGASKQAAIPNPLVTVKYPAPIITTVTPGEGKVTGGETVTITGEFFRDKARVSFAGTYSSKVDYISPTEVKALVPAGYQGTAELRLVNTDGQAAVATYIYYDNPLITSVSPNNGALEGNTVVQVRGSAFMKGAKVKFGDTYSPSVTFNNSSYLSARTPAGIAPGTVDVTVENPDERTATLPQSFTYNEPPKMTISSISPEKGLVTGGETITVIGTLIQPGTKVFFGDIEGSNYKYSSITSMVVNAPANPIAGPVDVRVEGPDGYSVTLPLAYTYETLPPPPAPTIKIITPAEGKLAGGDSIYVDGSGFQSGVMVFFDDMEITQATFINSSRIRVITPPWAVTGKVSITVINPDQQTASLSDAFEYLPPPPAPEPTLKAVTPGNGPFAGGNRVYVDGSNFVNGAQVYFNDQAVATTFVNATRLSITAPPATIQGYVNVKVINPDNKSVEKENAYSYDPPIIIPAPEITSISPNLGLTTGNYIIDIYGKEFQKNATVTIGANQINLYSYVNSTRVRVMVPASSIVGAVDVTITNPDGQSHTVQNGFTYEEPKLTVTRITPGNGPLAGNTSVYVDGANYDPGMTVTFNGQPISFTYVNNTRIRIITPAGTVSGPVPIVLTSPAGTTASIEFIYDAPPPIPDPTITKLSVTSGSIAGGYTLYVDGSAFQNGATIDFGGTNIIPQFVNNTRFKITVPPAAGPGVISVKVINPDGKVSNSKDFEYK
ncbi:IPT/TIG domain-containing protein [Paenibacillus lautus]|uniref:IPT/TIG domain-containing protein n=1 Tax=Paenibacillus lautus TaxID=1401 RepID=UPI002DB6C0B9|nr:IPT/TIG domain-containing protein [Paenibacillus lautus]MEC0310736.1 IPT/TIG domain-containing protein [Paenibacillus lautus]